MVKIDAMKKTWRNVPVQCEFSGVPVKGCTLTPAECIESLKRVEKNVAFGIESAADFQKWNEAVQACLQRNGVTADDGEPRAASH